MQSLQPACILFDLDGTLIDTAPDLLTCLNLALKQHQATTIDENSLRPYISYGALAMIERALPNCNDDSKQTILHTMLDLYQHNIAVHSRYFDGMEQVLDELDSHNIKWGIVTNKRERFTLPLMSAFGLDRRAACIISGDTTTNSKPHPEPMLKACAKANTPPEACIYIGDAKHDIEAGKNSGMMTMAALYGYLKPDDKPEYWGADILIESPQHLSDWIQTHLCN
ncbi:HAD family hydrolase [methane-oxidizing endosymbiont of Gigantopelta aegis]|uniref:HAD family hydrolase n=1 Tax=methane-oxidizing endosymbiont of Gigantopelta aegis TaxID=2794938 RepID=UPI0018DB0C6D|nr:HAD-IA family hydrolase [methane-oxidizing endosymbiont of Gigantopelta aegis]